MISRKIVSGIVISLICWIVGYLVVASVVDGMSGQHVYPLLVGWWLNAYVSSRLSVPLYSAFLLSVLYLIVFIAAAALGYDLLYREISDLGMFSILAIGLVQAAAVGSPILFDWVFLQALRHIRLPSSPK